MDGCRLLVGASSESIRHACCHPQEVPARADGHPVERSDCSITSGESLPRREFPPQCDPSTVAPRDSSPHTVAATQLAEAKFPLGRLIGRCAVTKPKRERLTDCDTPARPGFPKAPLAQRHSHTRCGRWLPPLNAKPVEMSITSWRSDL